MLQYTYLASPREIGDLGPNDIARYGYVGLFDFGTRQKKLCETERNLILASVAAFMKESCLFVAADSLRRPEVSGTYAHSVYSVFEVPRKLDAYIAMATVIAGVNDDLFLQPVFEELSFPGQSSGRYPFLKAVNAKLESLKLAVLGMTLESLLPVGFESRSVATPNSKLIKQLRKRRGSQETVAESFFEVGGTHESLISKRTLANVELYGTVNSETLSRLAVYFGATAEDFTLERIVMNKEKLHELRCLIRGREEEVAQQHGFRSPRFFELLESADSVSSVVFRCAHKVFRSVSKSRLGERDLIDELGTMALVQASGCTESAPKKG